MLPYGVTCPQCNQKVHGEVNLEWTRVNSSNFVLVFTNRKLLQLKVADTQISRGAGGILYQ